MRRQMQLNSYLLQMRELWCDQAELNRVKQVAFPAAVPANNCIRPG